MKKMLFVSAAVSMLTACGGPNLDCDDSGFKDKVVEHYNRTALENIRNRLVSSAEGLHPNPAESVAKEVIGKISDIKLADVRLISKNEQTKEAVCVANYTVTVDGQAYKNPIRYRLEYLLDSKETNVLVFNEEAWKVSSTIATAISKYSEAFRSANAEVGRQRERERVADFHAIENIYVEARKSAEEISGECKAKAESPDASARCDKEMVETKYRIYRDLIGALPTKFDQCVNLRAYEFYRANENKYVSDRDPLLSRDINQWKEECRQSS